MKYYKLCTLISTLAGYLEVVWFIVWYVEESHRMLGMLGLYAILILSGVLNLLLWGGYAIERGYAKKHGSKGCPSPAWAVIPGLVLNIIITVGSGCFLLFLYCLF